MSVRRLLVFTCDQDGRTAELDLELGMPVDPPAGWTVDDAGKVTCDRHKPPARAVLHTQMLRLRMTGPGSIPVRSMAYDMHAPGGATWTFTVPAEDVETEPR